MCIEPEEEKKGWSGDEIKKLFASYKTFGTKWSLLVKEFPGRTENDIKNKFYTTLKRVATRAQLEDPKKYSPSFIKCKNNLVQFVDAAMLYSQMLPSTRGRKKKSDRKLARQNAFIIPPKTLPTLATSLPNIIRPAPIHPLLPLPPILPPPPINHPRLMPPIIMQTIMRPMFGPPMQMINQNEVLYFAPPPQVPMLPYMFPMGRY